jgi:hypothetical protein
MCAPDDGGKHRCREGQHDSLDKIHSGEQEKADDGKQTAG